MKMKPGLSWLARLAGGAALACSFAASAANVAVVVPKNPVSAGEELGIRMVVEGPGTYDVYAALAGGALGPVLLLWDGGSNAWMPWDGVSQPSAVLRNADLGALPVDERIYELLPKMPLSGGLEGTYQVYGVLFEPGDLGQPAAMDVLELTIQ